MDVYEYAMAMEKDGEAYYRSAAEKTAHKGIKTILTMLADAEVTHYHIFESMKEGRKVHPRDATVLAGIKNIFLQMAESRDPSLVNLSEEGLYKKAQEIEQKSIDFYKEKADEADDERQKAMFLKVAGEEERHYLILENIILFVSRPDQWLENPEWYHLEDY